MYGQGGRNFPASGPHSGPSQFVREFLIKVNLKGPQSLSCLPEAFLAHTSAHFLLAQYCLVLLVETAFLKSKTACYVPFLYGKRYLFVSIT